MSGNVTLFLKKLFSAGIRNRKQEALWSQFISTLVFVHNLYLEAEYVYTIYIWRQSMYTHIFYSVLSHWKSSGAWQVIFRSRGLYIDHMRRSKKSLNAYSRWSYSKWFLFQMLKESDKKVFCQVKELKPKMIPEEENIRAVRLGVGRL